ncbi:hypothetical protein BLA29_013987 [Euroglyphus maynei]|uniref:Uncharacterized protein n=1 Tax=Euroglyphus maynei TaxID=6958 RepID=A0A1Y3B9A2_EURMA|nr:hypothetical protein BLA29_013987 [Euroglyphus maynei]
MRHFDVAGRTLPSSLSWRH